MAKLSKLLRAAHGIVKSEVGKFRNRHTVTMVQQITSIALSASSIVVVLFAERITHLTLAIVQKVAIVARCASSSVIPRFAIIRNRNADSVSIGDPSVRALEADLVIPIPSGTTHI